MKDPRWQRPCSLSGCRSPGKPHHHHYRYGHLSTSTCVCEQGGEPGTEVNQDRRSQPAEAQWWCGT